MSSRSRGRAASSFMAINTSSGTSRTSRPGARASAVLAENAFSKSNGSVVKILIGVSRCTSFHIWKTSLPFSFFHRSRLAGSAIISAVTGILGAQPIDSRASTAARKLGASNATAISTSFVTQITVTVDRDSSSNEEADAFVVKDADDLLEAGEFDHRAGSWVNSPSARRSCRPRRGGGQRAARRRLRRRRRCRAQGRW
jgi:hypothetical protein